MAEPSVSAASPGSTADSGKKSAVKNTRCKYCGTPFTTSSLGRHLDLYIREKNPKPPDGIHDVDEIRQMRGNVTRRHAKSSAKREGSTPSQSKATPGRDQSSPSNAIPPSGSSRMNGSHVNTQLNCAAWQATGVINGLPSVPRRSPSRSISRTEGPRSTRLTIALKEAAMEERDRALAVELALKEVLGSLKAANNRAHPPSPFYFDFFRLGFPGLCLRCMPPPRSMSSHHSNLGQESWPLEPPGSAEHDYMKRYLFAKLQEWKARLSQDDGSSDPSEDVDQHVADKLVKEEATYQQHFAQAYHNWQKLSQDKKQDQWRLECQKAYAEEYDRHQATRERLDHLEQEIHHLRDRLDQHKDGQPSSGFSIEVPSTPLNRSTMDASTAQQARGLQHWDYDRLLDKWKSRVRQERSVQHPLPAAVPYHSALTNGGASSGYEHPALGGEQQPYRHDGGNENEDEDLADAPGEDEDEDVMSTTPQRGTVARDVLDPNLRHDGGNADDGGRMLMELKHFPQTTNGNGATGSS
ncbi:MAG: hypothetical protein L6R35_007200 [Caloplaca aegaea]|nr:MAG: hypothetical protein L6R35_007200 [Caloplaca aegaea]